MPEPSVRLLDHSLTCGVKTNEMLEAEPYGFRVFWIKWDSGFRSTGLRIGDRIVGLNGERFELAKRKTGYYPGAVGMYNESQHWTTLGTSDGAEATLTVYRAARYDRPAEYLEIRGAVRAERAYYNAAGKQILGLGGPERLFQNDGFSDAWATWYDRQVEFAWRVLDGGWHQMSFNNRGKLTEHLAAKARLDLLLAKYPGPFADVVLHDWELVHRSLLGTTYQLGPDALVYREIGAKREAAIAAAAAPARQAFLDAHAADIIAPFPAIDPFMGDRSKVAGKLVVLPPIVPRDWAKDSGKVYLTTGDSRRGWYFADATEPPMQRLLAAVVRYQSSVTPTVRESHALIARITPNLKMIAAGGGAATGLLVDVVAATVGDKLFVDVSRDEGGLSRFAGEESLASVTATPPAGDATPAQVIESLIAALKIGDQKLWSSLFADWEASKWNDGKVYYYPHRPWRSLDSEWVRARRLILDKVHDIRIHDVFAIQSLMTGREFEGAPVLDQVVVELDHIGRFGDEDRVFVDINVRRLWSLQRRNGGPWRITSRQGI
jgi:hypothetical protein